ERLSSCVFLLPSNTYAIFVSGDSLTRFNRDPSPDDLKPFTKYRADRILILAPKASLDATRQLWSSFQGANSGTTGVPRGKVSTGDLPALFVLETILELRVIDSGWWRDVHFGIDASS